MSKILLAGEQVTAFGFEIKGFDVYTVSSNNEEGQALVKALEGGGHEVDWMRTSDVPVEFPESLAALASYDAVILSDLGSNSLLFHPDMLNKSERRPNRLKVLKEYVSGGDGLIMIGGWMSFAGIDGKAKYHSTDLEEALPVTCLPYDDRQEKPDGVVPEIIDKNHPVLRNIPSEWPFFLGYNRVTTREGASELMSVDSDPLLSVWDFGDGRSAAFTTDCGPHWGPTMWLEWAGYAIFWDNLIRWVSKSS